jgi:hypothetical protein
MVRDLDRKRYVKVDQIKVTGLGKIDKNKVRQAIYRAFDYGNYLRV